MLWTEVITDAHNEIGKVVLIPFSEIMLTVLATRQKMSLLTALRNLLFLKSVTAIDRFTSYFPFLKVCLIVQNS